MSCRRVWRDRAAGRLSRRRSRGVAWPNTRPCQGRERRFESGRDRHKDPQASDVQALERWPSPVEGDGLENRYGSLAHREFESLPLRHFPRHQLRLSTSPVFARLAPTVRRSRAFCARLATTAPYWGFVTAPTCRSPRGEGPATSRRRTPRRAPRTRRARTHAAARASGSPASMRRGSANARTGR